MTQQLLAALSRLAPRRILVVGDLALDEYLVGRVTRLSREAAVVGGGVISGCDVVQCGTSFIRLSACVSADISF